MEQESALWESELEACDVSFSGSKVTTKETEFESFLRTGLQQRQ